MVVGLLEIELRLDGCRSLKDKRHTVRGLLDRIRRDFHASAAEVADHDLWGNATIGIAIVGASSHELESALQKIVDVIDANPAVAGASVRREITRQ